MKASAGLLDYREFRVPKGLPEVSALLVPQFISTPKRGMKGSVGLRDSLELAGPREASVLRDLRFISTLKREMKENAAPQEVVGLMGLMGLQGLQVRWDLQDGRSNQILRMMREVYGRGSPRSDLASLRLQESSRTGLRTLLALR